MEYHYYILQNGFSTDKQNLKPGTFILRIPTCYSINFNEGNGPYKSLRALKKYSPIYKFLLKTNTHRAQQIINQKNIITSKKLIATPKESEFNKKVIDGFIHATIGRIKNGNLTGIHFFDPERVRILEIIEENIITNVFKAKFEFFDTRTKQWVQKKSATTFFPKHWNLATLLMECKFAFDQLNETALKDGKIKSLTKSNIEVVIIIKNGILKSLYPLI